MLSVSVCVSAIMNDNSRVIAACSFHIFQENYLFHDILPSVRYEESHDF